MPQQEEKWVEDVAGVFCDPVIVWPGPWQEDTPKWIFEAITMERLIMEMKSIKGEPVTATDAEVVAYMYPRTLENPLDHDWTEIYCYTAQKVVAFHRHTEFPEGERVKKLSDWQERLLAQLKYDIYQSRMKHRAETRRQQRAPERQAAKEQATQKKIIQEKLQPGFDL